MTSPEFTVEFLAPETLAPSPANFRRHPALQKSALEASIEEHGWLSAPIVSKQTKRILDGHARVELALERGEASIPVRVVDVSEAQEQRILRAFDKIGAMAEIDTEALDRLIEAIDDAQLERLLGELAEPESGLLPEADPDAVPDDAPTRAQAGDIWLLGEHKLAVCDCTDAAAVERLFAGKKLSLVWTDPPYGVSYGEKNAYLNRVAPLRTTGGGGNRIETPIVGDDMTETATEDLCRAALTLACEHALPGAAVYVACPPGTLLPHFIAAVAASGFQFKHSLAWVKNQFVLGRCDYHYRHEIVLYGWKEGAHYFADDHTQDSVFEIDKPRRSEEHPTMKPVALVQQMVENSSRPTEIVYDPFLGSGSTLLACEAVQRACYGCEVSEQYASVILARWEQATGKVAQLQVRSA